jgi:hypothetical protein
MGMTRIGNLGTAPHPRDEDWRCIAEQTSRETDPVKLSTLVAKLCLALDREHEPRPQFRLQKDQTQPLPTESLPNFAQQRAE